MPSVLNLDDSSTVVSSVASVPFPPHFYAGTAISQPTATTPITSATSSHKRKRTAPKRFTPEPFQRPRKQHKSTKTTASRPPPTGIKLRLRNPVAARKRGYKGGKIWFFKTMTGEWGTATNDPHKAQWLRQQYACARWIIAVDDATPLGFEDSEQRRDRDRKNEDWSWDRYWGAELMPMEALGEW